MSVLLIHRSSRFNTEDPNTFTGPEFLSLSRDRLSHEPGKCLLKNMLNQQVLQPGTSLEKHRQFPTENPVSTWPCCGRVLDPRPTLMPWRHVKGPMAQLVAKKHAFWTEPKQPHGIRCVLIFMSLSQCDVISNSDWWPLMTPDLSFGHLSFVSERSDREPIFADDQHACCAFRSLHESTVWGQPYLRILDDHVRWLKIQRPSNGKWMDMIWLDQCAVESQCMYKAKTVEIHLNAPYYIPGYPRYVYMLHRWYIIIIY